MDIYVYDKAKYHFGGDYPEGLPTEQAYVHTGLFLGWIIDQDLYSEEFEEDAKEDINLFKRREMTGPEIYQNWDGVLAEDMLNEEGNQFARNYFDFENGEYLNDYAKVFDGLPTLYHVENSWDNYEKIKAVIERRYDEWKNK